MRLFLSRIEKLPPRRLDQSVAQMEKEVWNEVDCLSCSNCCRSMTPTFTRQDIKRISSHFGVSQDDFVDHWLYKDKDGDWMNKKIPCQFLNLDTNKCSIYEIRPDDCAGFPHLSKKKMVEYIHVHKQNIEHCPATYRMVEKMQLRFAEKN